MEGGFDKATGKSVTGVDVICIKINNRHPKTGGFPKAIDGGQEPHTEYVNGKVYSRQEIYEVLLENPDRRFFKYGCGTGWTTGHFRGDGAMFCTPHPKPDKNGDFKICLHKQIEICSETESDFAGKSDSGALVFMEVNDELVAIGMIVASMPGELVSFVTPLDEILKALNLRAKGMKTFSNASIGSTGQDSYLLEGMAKVQTDVQASVASIKLGFEKLGNDIENIGSDMQIIKDEITKSNTGIESLVDSLKSTQPSQK